MHDMIFSLLHSRRMLLFSLFSLAFWMVILTLASIHDAEATPLRMRIAAVQRDDMAYVDALKALATRIERESAGRLHILLKIGGRHYGSEPKQLKKQIRGTVEAGLISATVMARAFPTFRLLLLPFLFTDFNQVQTFLQTPLEKALRRSVHAKDLVVLGYGFYGFYGILSHLSLSNWDALRDLSRTVRIPDDPWLWTIHNAMGLRPAVTPPADVPMALQSGAIQAVVATPENLDRTALPHSNSTFGHTRHLLGWSVLTANAAWFDGLSPDLQKIIRQAAKTFTENSLKSARFREQAVLKKWRDDQGPSLLSLSENFSGHMMKTLRPLIQREARHIEKKLGVFSHIQRLWDQNMVLSAP